jgi:TRAP-type uncharacterized transport system fused permease subunit
MHVSTRSGWPERLISRWRRIRDSARDAGMSTAEYAVGTLAAVAFAGVLLKVVTSPGIQSALSAIISKALK